MTVHRVFSQSLGERERALNACYILPTLVPGHCQPTAPSLEALFYMH